MFKIQDAVSETLLIPLYMRYHESLKPDPIIHDEEAMRLIPQIDYDFSKFDTAIRSSVGSAIRAVYLDEVTKTFIQRHQQPIIVMIGCGLDSRNKRVGDIGNHVPFYELDLPDVIALRRQLLPPADNEILLAASALETDWMDELRTQHPHASFLFVIEGVLMYFSEAQVKKLFKDLAARFSGGEIAFDIGSTWMSRNSQKHHDVMKHMRAQFDYGCDDDHEMERWAHNLQLISAKYMFDFPTWKRIGLLKAAIMWIVPTVRRSYRFLHYRMT
ncbi:class I SAM-dependent methyltransferase [Aggregatibacter kilianii]|uniref:class I SAM-dependent methyltransferase n=1 Tax=Aggregatibacter kilianii TaxID=2025884 RepID=UPI000D65103E|nr:class I SAM-dependent methyltransferase [Aggregatibacter kilianii]